MRTSEQINEIATALALAQGELKDAIADAQGNYGKYADLTSIRKAMREPFAKHGLAVVQMPITREGKHALVSRVMHKSGQWIEDEMDLLIDRPTMQGMGSAITYAKRYTLAAIAGLAEEDDDGEAAERFPGQTHTHSKANEAKSHKHVTEGQLKRLYAIMNSRASFGWSKEGMENVAISLFNLKESLSELNMGQYDKLIDIIEKTTYQEAMDKIDAWLKSKEQTK